MKRREVDPRVVILKTAEARMGARSHAELAKFTGIKTATVQKRFREPGTTRLDELAAMVGTVLTEAEMWELVTGRRPKR